MISLYLPEVSDRLAYPLLEQSDLLIGHSIRLGNDRDKVDFGMKSSHEFDIDGFQTIP